MSRQDTLLALIGDLVGVLDLAEFRWALLRALQHALPVDWISLNDIGENPDEVVVLSDPSPPADLLAHFAAYAHENPLVVHYVRTRDGRPIRFSDLLTPVALHRLELYRRVYRPLGIEHQMAFTLPNGPNRILGVALSRRTSDFTDGERHLIERARPFFIQAYRNAVAHTELMDQLERPHPTIPDALPLRSRGLTERESEVLCLLATGAAESQIAERLGISVRTVEKHLQNSYRRLGVNTRAQAAAIAWAG
jgi:DNA-binding CsgD family transcriptional regulator